MALKKFFKQIWVGSPTKDKNNSSSTSKLLGDIDAIKRERIMELLDDGMKAADIADMEEVDPNIVYKVKHYLYKAKKEVVSSPLDDFKQELKKKELQFESELKQAELQVQLQAINLQIEEQKADMADFKASLLEDVEDDATSHDMLPELMPFLKELLTKSPRTKIEDTAATSTSYPTDIIDGAVKHQQTLETIEDLNDKQVLEMYNKIPKSVLKIAKRMSRPDLIAEISTRYPNQLTELSVRKIVERVMNGA